MVLMSVGDHKTFDFIDVTFQISHIRDDQIDSQHIIGRECKTTVDNHDGVFILECSNIHTDLLQTAKRDNAYLRLGSSICQDILCFWCPYRLFASCRALCSCRLLRSYLFLCTCCLICFLCAGCALTSYRFFSSGCCVPCSFLGSWLSFFLLFALFGNFCSFFLFRSLSRASRSSWSPAAVISCRTFRFLSTSFFRRTSHGCI